MLTSHTEKDKSASQRK